MRDEIAEHLEDLGCQPRTLARPLQGIKLCVQGTIGKAVDHTSSAEQWQSATETCGEIEQYGHVAPRASTRSSGRSSFFYGSDIHVMLALRRRSRQIVMTDEELNGPNRVGELLGKGQ